MSRPFCILALAWLALSLGPLPAQAGSWAVALSPSQLSGGQARLAPDSSAWVSLTSNQAGQGQMVVKLDPQGQRAASRVLGGAYQQRLVLDLMNQGTPLLSGVRDSQLGSGFNLAWASLDQDLNQIYAKSWELPGDQDGLCSPDGDGGLLCLGDTPPAGISSSARDLVLLGINQAGSVQWDLVLDHDNYDHGLDWSQGPDAYYVLGCHGPLPASAGDLLMVKLSLSGQVQWTRSLTGAGFNTPVALEATPDGGVVLLASARDTSNDQDSDFLLAKLSASGNLAWARRLDSGQTDIPSSLVLSPAGNPVAAGWFKNTASGNQDLVVLELDSGGNLARQKVFTGLGSANALIYNDGEGYLLGGLTSAPSGGGSGKDALMIALGADLNPAWQQALGSLGDDQGGALDPPGQGYLAFFQTEALTGQQELGLVSLPPGGQMENCFLVREPVLSVSQGTWQSWWTPLQAQAVAPVVTSSGRQRDLDLQMRDLEAPHRRICP